MENIKVDKRKEQAKINGLLGGRPLGSVASHTLTAQEARKWITEQTTKRLLPLYEVLYAKALDGDMMAIKELLERSYGKSVQGMEISGKDGNPLIFLPLELIQKHNLPVKADATLIENSQ